MVRLAQGGHIKIWLVGGFLRDALGGQTRSRRDFDFCVEKNVLPFVKKFCRSVKGRLIVLDDVQKTYRVIVKSDAFPYVYDFTLMRGKSIRDDVFARDFPVNAGAVDVTARRPVLLDFCGGVNDLKKGVLRVLSKQAFRDDPLRVLRAFSAMAGYGFKIEPATLKEIVRCKRLLARVSGERLSEELFKVFAAAHSFAAVQLMDKTGVIDEVIPAVKATRGVRQGGYHHLDVWRHSLETLRCFEAMDWGRFKAARALEDYLDAEVAQGRTFRQLLKLACLLHDIGKPAAKRRNKKKTIFYGHEEIGRKLCIPIARRLRLSARESDTLKRLVLWHLRPGYLADQGVPTPRARYRFFRDAGSDAVAVLILSLSDWRATRGPLTNARERRHHDRVMRFLVDEHLMVRRKKTVPKLVDGYDVMKRCALKPSPLVGLILKKLQEEIALGKIKSKEEALREAAVIAAKAVETNV